MNIKLPSIAASIQNINSNNNNHATASVTSLSTAGASVSDLQLLLGHSGTLPFTVFTFDDENQRLHIKNYYRAKSKMNSGIEFVLPAQMVAQTSWEYSDLLHHGWFLRGDNEENYRWLIQLTIANPTSVGGREETVIYRVSSEREACEVYNGVLRVIDECNKRSLKARKSTLK